MTTSEQIAAAALRLFYRNGFHASGVDLLSQEAGITKKTLYRYYASKEALIDAALALRHRQFMSCMRTSVEAAEASARPLAYIAFISNWVTEPTFHGCAFINATAEYAQSQDAPHQQSVAHKQEVRDYVLTLCTAAGASDPLGAATALFLLGEGLIVGSQVQGPDPVLLDVANSTARALWMAATGASA